jgi:hypothetical protein
LTKKDNLDSYLRLFAKEEAFFFKLPAHERPTTSVCEAIQFRPRRRLNTAAPEAPRVIRGRFWKRIV